MARKPPVDPQDYDLSDPSPRHELIGDTELFDLARESPAKAVLFVIDACREKTQLQLVASKGAGEAQIEPPAESPSIAMLFSCGTDELSHATNASDSHSYFTRALCEVLQADDNVDTLETVCAAVKDRLQILLPHGITQTPTLGDRRAKGRAGEPLKLILKESPAARLSQQIDLSHWCQRTRQGSVWKRVTSGSKGLADQLLAIVQGAEAVFRRAQSRLPRQRWGDEKAPARVIQRLELLLGDAVGDLLSPAEAAIAIAVPHVYEAMLAAAELRLLKDGDPLLPGRYGSGSSRMAGALRNRIAAEAASATHGKFRYSLVRNRPIHMYGPSTLSSRSRKAGTYCSRATWRSPCLSPRSNDPLSRIR